MMHRVGDPDPTPNFDGDCDAQIPETENGTRYFCTWPKGHTGQHVAGDGESVVAVWGEPELDHDHDWADGTCQFPTCDAAVPALTFTLTIELGNDGMLTNDNLADALNRTATALVYGDTPNAGTIRDLNGNTVGSWAVQ